MSEELKPCAYCQSPLEFEWMTYEPYKEGGRWFVVCSNPECPTNINNDEEKEVLIKLLNDRHEPRCMTCKLFREKCPETWVDSIGNVERICDVKGIKFCSFYMGITDE